MDRREALKALGVVPFVRLPYKDTQLPAVELGAKRFLIFVDVQAFNLEEMTKQPWSWPGIEAELWPVQTYGGKSVEECLAIYDVSAESLGKNS